MRFLFASPSVMNFNRKLAQAQTEAVERDRLRFLSDLRDRMAMCALPGIIQTCLHDTRNPDEDHPAMFARKAYDIADAMLAAREGQP